MKKEKNAPKKFDMALKNGRLNDINLYIYNEKNLYSKTHVHSFYEIVLIMRGKVLQAINGKERILGEHDICILRPEAQHLIRPHAKSPVILYNFEVREEYMDGLCKTLGFTSVNDVLSQAESYTRFDTAATTDHKLVSFPSNPQNHEHPHIKQIFLKMAVAKILMNYIVNPVANSPQKKEEHAISSILNMLGDIRNFKLSIKQICEKTFYTQEHVTRLFQKAGLDSPNRIHLQKKMQYAENLLVNSDLKIIEIAELVGIETVAYFTKVFKKEYGVPPSVYKKEHNANTNP